MLSTQGAVWKYWRDILYAWAGATTLDFAPLFFMGLLAIAVDHQRQEQAGATSDGQLKYRLPPASRNIDSAAR